MDNIIFDVTLKSPKALEDISELVIGAGYSPKNIHIVYVANMIEVALSNNNYRHRRVTYEVFIETHDGARKTVVEFITKQNYLQEYMDGDFWIVFNQAKVDSDVAKNKRGEIAHFERAEIFKIKEAGKKIMTLEQILQTAQKSSTKVTKDIFAKLLHYTDNSSLHKG